MVEVAITIAVLAMSGQVKESLQGVLKDAAIRDYRDSDINRRNVIDWFQETVSNNVLANQISVTIILMTFLSPLLNFWYKHCHH